MKKSHIVVDLYSVAFFQPICSFVFRVLFRFDRIAEKSIDFKNIKGRNKNTLEQEV